jgi:uncharacterized damage-inducible protein DinB
MSETNPSYQKLLESYTALPEQLVEAVSELSEDQLNTASGPGEWSIRQIVHHLADGQTMWTICMRVAIGTPGTAMQFPAYPGNDAWSEQMAYAERNIEPGLRLLRAVHDEIAELLTLMPEAWEREVVMGVPGSGSERAYSVAQIVQFTSDHFVEHLGEIATIKEKAVPMVVD